ncbi:CDP-archaeol synthase [Candidatus Woesearchaeota archaeon]|nr:CDP-archaeol synthase [Candidatus Woesearchaeota archaeon]MBI2130600.1 CDP-archaeol synthase [Candidatus Woesearchaeota archaeon]
MPESFAFFVLKCFYFMLPAYLSNMAPVFVKKIFNFMAVPLDFNKTMNGKPILGENKTFRGVFFGTLFGILIAFLQYYLYQYGFYRNLSFFDYSNWLLFGFLMGFGAIISDSIKSFFKRRAGVKPGDKFMPFDQVDFVIGGLVFIMPVFSLTWAIFLTSLLLSFLLHILSVHVAFYLHIRDEKW